MLARAAPILVVCLVIGCRCPTTPPVAAEGPQILARALDMGAAGGGGPGQGAPVCFRGEGTDCQQAYDVCLAAAPDSVCGGGRWCAAEFCIENPYKNLKIKRRLTDGPA